MARVSAGAGLPRDARLQVPGREVARPGPSRAPWLRVPGRAIPPRPEVISSSAPRPRSRPWRRQWGPGNLCWEQPLPPQIHGARNRRVLLLLSPSLTSTTGLGKTGSKGSPMGTPIATSQGALSILELSWEWMP